MSPIHLDQASVTQLLCCWLSQHVDKDLTWLIREKLIWGANARVFFTFSAVPRYTGKDSGLTPSMARN